MYNIQQNSTTHSFINLLISMDNFPNHFILLSIYYYYCFCCFCCSYFIILFILQENKKKMQRSNYNYYIKMQYFYTHFFFFFKFCIRVCFHLLIKFINTKIIQYSNIFPRCISSQFCPFSRTDFEIRAPNVIQGNVVVPSIKYMQIS